jgi:1-acyl-sn-glycerol-3-phosphate acyltransferase
MFQRRLGPLYKLLNKNIEIHITGLENIDKDSNYIFAMNHQSVLDIPIAFAILVPRTEKRITLFMSRFVYALFFPLMRPLGGLWINMNKRKSEKSSRFNRGQIIKGIQRLRSGSSALIYPEGTSTGGVESQILRGETGTIRMALRSGVPIIPIGIRGSNDAYPFPLKSYNPFIFRTKHPVFVKVGSPIYLEKPPEVNLKRYSEDVRILLRQMTDQLMDQLANLSGLPRTSS